MQSRSMVLSSAGVERAGGFVRGVGGLLNR